MSTTLRILLIVLLVAATGFGLGAVFAGGAWRDLWLNLLAETFGAALVVFVVDRLFERSRRRAADERRRAALGDLRLVLRELRLWLVGLSLGSGSEGRDRDGASTGGVPFASLLDGFSQRLGTIDFAAPGPYERDRYFAEWARRTFDATALELARWERNFAGSEGIFDDTFRPGAEGLHRFVRDIGSFLDGMERYVVREQPAAPVGAYGEITELTEEAAGRLASDLERFLAFYRDQCERYEASVFDSDVIDDP